MICVPSQGFWLSLWLGVIAVIGRATAADDFTCGDYENAMDLGVGTDFSTVSVTLDCASSFKNGIVPGSINWHIYVMGADSTPKYAAYPPGLLQPRITKSGLLQFQVVQQLTGVAEGESAPGAVDLFLPYTLVNQVSGSGISETVQISNTDSSAAPSNLRIVVTGTNSKYYVNSTASSVNFDSQGIGTYVEAEVLGGSFAFTGVNSGGMILNRGGELDVSMTGVDQSVTIQGSYSSAKVTGVNGQISINDSSGCSKVNTGGLNAECNKVDTVVTVSEPSCLSNAQAINLQCGVSWSGSSALYTNYETLLGILSLLLVSSYSYF